MSAKHRQPLWHPLRWARMAGFALLAPAMLAPVPGTAQDSRAGQSGAEMTKSATPRPASSGAPAPGDVQLPGGWNSGLGNLSFPGGLGLIRLADERANARAYFNGRRVLLTRIGNHTTAVIGLSTELKPGRHELKLQLPDGNELLIPFDVAGRDYPTVNFEYPRKYRHYDEAALARIRREKQIITRLKKTYTPRIPDLNFDWPALGRLSSPFGNRRVFLNRASTHSGLDIAQRTGADVWAAADGVVLDANDYYFTGNTVFIDHGCGVLSLYAHLNDMVVSAGQEIRRGELIGHIGNTGRSTGPHLHFSVGFNGVWIDPAIVLPARPKEARVKSD